MVRAVVASARRHHAGRLRNCHKSNITAQLSPGALTFIRGGISAHSILHVWWRSSPPLRTIKKALLDLKASRGKTRSSKAFGAHKLHLDGHAITSKRVMKNAWQSSPDLTRVVGRTWFVFGGRWSSVLNRRPAAMGAGRLFWKQVSRIRADRAAYKEGRKIASADLDPKDKSFSKLRLLANPTKFRCGLPTNSTTNQVLSCPLGLRPGSMGAREGPGFPTYHSLRTVPMRLVFHARIHLPTLRSFAPWTLPGGRWRLKATNSESRQSQLALIAQGIELSSADLDTSGAWSGRHDSREFGIRGL